MKTIICYYFLDSSKLICTFECTTAAGIFLNDGKFGKLYGNHIRRLTRKWSVVDVFTKDAYVLNKKVWYVDSRALVGSYLETIYT